MVDFKSIDLFINEQLNEKANPIQELEKLIAFLTNLDNDDVSDLYIHLVHNDKVSSFIKNSNNVKIISDEVQELIDFYNRLNVLEEIGEEQLNTEKLSEGLSTNDPVRMYLDEIGKIPLLSEEEERILLKRIRAGDDEAKRRFIKANLRLVVWVASSRYYGRMSLLDKIQEGNLGLINAIEKFDYSKSYKFSTYAVPVIKRAIIRGTQDKERAIRIPVNLCDDIAKIRKTISVLEIELNREPTPEEIAEKTKIAVTKIEELMGHDQDIMSLNIKIGEDKNYDFGDLIPSDFNFDDLESAINYEELMRIMEKILLPRQIIVLKLRLGLEDGIEKTLEEVGKLLGISREMVRQLEGRALKRLRKHSKIRKFNPSSDDSYLNTGKRIESILVPKISFEEFYQYFNKLGFNSEQVNNVLPKLIVKEKVILLRTLDFNNEEEFKKILDFNSKEHKSFNKNPTNGNIEKYHLILRKLIGILKKEYRFEIKTDKNIENNENRNRIKINDQIVDINKISLDVFYSYFTIKGYNKEQVNAILLVLTLSDKDFLCRVIDANKNVLNNLFDLMECKNYNFRLTEEDFIRLERIQNKILEDLIKNNSEIVESEFYLVDSNKKLSRKL